MKKNLFFLMLLIIPMMSFGAEISDISSDDERSEDDSDSTRELTQQEFDGYCFDLEKDMEAHKMQEVFSSAVDLLANLRSHNDDDGRQRERAIDVLKSVITGMYKRQNNINSVTQKDRTIIRFFQIVRVTSQSLLEREIFGEADNASFIQFLLEGIKVNPNMRLSDGSEGSIVYEATRSMRKDILDMLIKNGAKCTPKEQEVLDFRKNIIWYSENLHYRFIENELGGNKDAFKSEENPLYENQWVFLEALVTGSSKRKHVEKNEFLRKMGALVMGDIQQLPEVIAEKIEERNDYFIEVMLACGMNPDLKSNYEDEGEKSLLEHAFDFGTKKTIKNLLVAGATIPQSICENEENAALLDEIRTKIVTEALPLLPSFHPVKMVYGVRKKRQAALPSLRPSKRLHEEDEFLEGVHKRVCLDDESRELSDVVGLG